MHFIIHTELDYQKIFGIVTCLKMETFNLQPLLLFDPDLQDYNTSKYDIVIYGNLV